jgi:hypothetical protein
MFACVLASYIAASSAVLFATVLSACAKLAIARATHMLCCTCSAAMKRKGQLRERPRAASTTVGRRSMLDACCLLRLAAWTVHVLRCFSPLLHAASRACAYDDGDTCWVCLHAFLLSLGRVALSFRLRTCCSHLRLQWWAYQSQPASYATRHSCCTPAHQALHVCLGQQVILLPLQPL